MGIVFRGKPAFETDDFIVRFGNNGGYTVNPKNSDFARGIKTLKAMIADIIKRASAQPYWILNALDLLKESFPEGKILNDPVVTQSNDDPDFPVVY